MAVGDLITAQRYNDMLLTLRKVLGNGGGDDGDQYGYGQTLQSVDKVTTPVADVVFAQDMVDLLTDINKAVTHQTGDASTQLIEILQGDIIADDVSDDTIVSSGDGDKKGYVDFENVITAIDANKSDAADNVLEELNPQSTDTNWRGQIQHTISIRFDGGYAVTNTDGSSGTASAADHYRHFFNTGGSIVFTGSVSSPNDPLINTIKNDNWSGMLDAMGEVLFDASGTGSLTSPTGNTTTGAFNIPQDTTYRTVYTKIGSSFYTDNSYIVEARKPTASTLDFRITMLDADPTNEDIDNPSYPPTDEYVTGTTASTISIYRADGLVTVLAPTIVGTPGFAVTVG